MLETSISELQAAVIRLTQVIELGLQHVNAPSPVATPVVAPAPVVIPVFTAPAAPVLPFTDSNSLVSYVMGVYKAIGPVKGAGIQNVLTSLGVVNLTDVKPEMYAAFYAGVEALKG